MSDVDEIDMDELLGSGLNPARIARARAAVRHLGTSTTKRRGCEFCLNLIVVTREYLRFVAAENYQPGDVAKSARIRFCRFKRCPFPELDEVKKDYLKEWDAKVAERINMSKLLGSALASRSNLKPKQAKEGKIND